MPNAASQTPPNGQPQNFAQGSIRILFGREWNLSDKKVSKALTLFDGHAQNYRNWAERVKDHCKEVNHGYAQIFQFLESSKTRIFNCNLGMGTLANGSVVDYLWLSQHMWVFIGKNISNDLHG